MSSFLSAPKGKYEIHSEKPLTMTTTTTSSQPIVNARPPTPAYLHRKGFIPHTLLDFDDGGSFPEIHLAQYPLHMGKKEKLSSNVLSTNVTTGTGSSSYNAIAQRGQGTKKVYSGFTDIVEKRIIKSEVKMPTLEQEQETARKTQEAFDSIVSGKVKSARPTNIVAQKSAKESSTYFRYTANPDAPGYNPKAATRVIRMVEAPVDPMEPPKFKHRKAPRGPGSPPVPILHSPPRKITVQDQQSWKIPPCISNWKNAKGYTIPLDKRLAADGRGLQETTINDNFASFSEALSIAERKAREEVNMRSQVQKKLAMKEKEAKEEELRELASRARQERAGLAEPEELDDTHYGPGAGRGAAGEEEEDDKMARLNRDKLRKDRKREREREMRMDHMGKKGKMARDEDRDVSERIALGQLHGTGAAKSAGTEGLFDSRLFNQSQGMSSGFGAEEEYSVYSKPLQDRGAAGSIYRPKVGAGDMHGDAEKQLEELRNTSRFKPDKDFQGTDRSAAGRRDGPVQFEKEPVKDPFGLDKFLTEARSGKKAMDSIGKTGGMASSASVADKEHYTMGSSRDSIKFTSSRRKDDDSRNR